MKTTKFLASILTVAAVMLLVSGCNAEDKAEVTETGNPEVTASAQEVKTSSSRIAVLDLGLVINTCDLCKMKLSDLQTQRDKLQSEFDAQKKSFDQKQTEIQRKKTVMSEADFKAEVTKFQSDIRAEEEKFKKKQEDLIQARNAALEELRKKIIEVIAEMAATEKIALIINRQETILADSKLDITEAVLKRVNELVK